MKSFILKIDYLSFDDVIAMSLVALFFLEYGVHNHMVPDNQYTNISSIRVMKAYNIGCNIKQEHDANRLKLLYALHNNLHVEHTACYGTPSAAVSTAIPSNSI